tara:strand:- start:54 stop:191 length:138 start_codon:yes stop_codon:yes gene_type:complete
MAKVWVKADKGEERNEEQIAGPAVSECTAEVLTPQEYPKLYPSDS